MKKNLFTVTMAAMLVAGGMFTGCDTTSADKVNKAEENVKDAEKNLKEAKAGKVAAVEKEATDAEWKVFKEDSDAKIAMNEARIAEMKDKMKSSGKTMGKIYAGRIENIEKKNVELKERLDNFDKEQTNWDSFKREFNHDMGEIGSAFKELGTDSSK